MVQAAASLSLHGRELREAAEAGKAGEVWSLPVAAGLLLYSQPDSGTCLTNSPGIRVHTFHMKHSAPKAGLHFLFCITQTPLSTVTSAHEDIEYKPRPTSCRTSKFCYGWDQSLWSKSCGDSHVLLERARQHAAQSKQVK